MEKEITIVICTYNRARWLEVCLESVLIQTADQTKYDVIVVNNNCTDDTSEVVAKYASKQSNIREVHESEVGLSAARNRGYMEANSKYVGYMDDDAKMDPGYIQRAIEIIQQEAPKVFGGPIYPFYESQPKPWVKPEYNSYSVYEEEGTLKDNQFLSGSSIIVEKNLLQNLGGFNTNVGMKGSKGIGYHEETLFQIRAREEGAEIKYYKDLIAYHLVPDIKQDILFYILANYRSGYESTRVWKYENHFELQTKLTKYVDGFFDQMQVAVKERDQDKFPYSENYIMEKALGDVYEIGKSIAVAKMIDSDLKTSVKYLRGKYRIGKLLRAVVAEAFAGKFTKFRNR